MKILKNVLGKLDSISHKKPLKTKMVYLYGNNVECKTILNNYKLTHNIESVYIESDADRYHFFFFVHIAGRSYTRHSRSVIGNVYNFYNKTDDLEIKEYNLDDSGVNLMREYFHEFHSDLDTWDFDISKDIIFNPWFTNNGTWRYIWETRSVVDIFESFRKPQSKINIIRSSYSGRNNYDLFYAVKTKKYIKKKK